MTNNALRLPWPLIGVANLPLLIVFGTLLTSGHCHPLSFVHFDCPAKEVVDPCKCLTWEPSSNGTDTEVEIVCRDNRSNETSLSELFRVINDHTFQTEGTHHFESLRLENTAISAIRGEIFGAISFRNVDLFNNLDLSSFDLNSFNQSLTSLESLCIQGSPLVDNDHKLFSALSGFVNLETLILSNNQLEGLPEGLFNQVVLTNLSYVDLSGNNITELGRKSFAKLPELSRLNLDNNQITKLTNETFSFDQEESAMALIFLRYNNLTADSFEKGMFLDVEKTVFVYMNHNQITHVDEAIFRPIVEAKNDLFFALWNNPFECDCRSKWLLELPDYFKKRFHGIKCQDKREIWDYSWKSLRSVRKTFINFLLGYSFNV
ncbi:Oplophorus-luciferin 2-monooxygenase non-catalytic subunit [Halotydeus destructor]|nr:Oplophorus-luciferin 2-monooxygenase non-catalytic subunit [Halotydeus destructor]